jgi:hypothetical protein
MLSAALSSMFLGFFAYWVITIRWNRRDWRKKSTANSNIAIFFGICALLLAQIAYAAFKSGSFDQHGGPILLGRITGICIGTVLGWALHRVFVEDDSTMEPQHKRPMDRNPQDV